MNANALAKIAIKLEAVQKEDELTEFLQWCLDNKIEKVLEIGCWKGGLLSIWETFGIAYGLDNGSGLKPFQFKKLYNQHSLLVPLNSQDEKTKEWFVNRDHTDFDLIFIDGDHTYNGVKRDYELYGSLGRYVAFHDILTNAPGVGVPEFWKEVKTGTESIEICHYPLNWGGIGILV